MINYLDFVAKIEKGLDEKNTRIWRQFSFEGGRSVSLYVSGEKGILLIVSYHFFLTYIKHAKPGDFDAFSEECLNYVMKAAETFPAKKSVSNCLVIPCIATDTSYRELSERAGQSEKTKEAKTNFLTTTVMPCLLNLTTHKSFYPTNASPLLKPLLNPGRDFLEKLIIPNNKTMTPDAKNR